MHWKTAGACFVLSLAATVACSSSPSNSTPPAQQAFWTSFHAGDYTNVDTVIQGLSDDFDANPNDSARAEYLGVANTWAAAESYRNPATAQSTSMSHGQASAQALQTAITLDPTNYFAAGFLAIGMIDEATFMNNAQLAGQGWGLLEQTTANLPTFRGFLTLFASRYLPVSDPKVQQGLDAMWTSFDTCIGGTLDRKNPDYAPYYNLGSGTNVPRFCWNTDKAPHALEGEFLYMGDALVKAGQIDVAKVFYANAKGVSSFASWTHASVISDRLSSDLNARADAYKNPDPTTWPQFGDGAFQCTVCHGSTGK